MRRLAKPKKYYELLEMCNVINRIRSAQSEIINARPELVDGEWVIVSDTINGKPVNR